jgi:hypothetical protein
MLLRTEKPARCPDWNGLSHTETRREASPIEEFRVSHGFVNRRLVNRITSTLK